MRNFPLHCPSCENRLNVKSLECENCGTLVSGNYRLPLLACLSKEDQDFVLAFVKESGRLNIMAKQLNLSYPTLRNKLDDLIEKIKKVESEYQNPEI